MAGVKNNKSKREAAKPVLTARVCSQCKERVMSNEVALIKSITFNGAKRSSAWQEFHRKHLPKI
ncbi:MAG: hypothetical protein EBU08_22270 [Micrococcales bacterium]|nr:hypothetical protein [Micrococcales bacterium]